MRVAERFCNTHEKSRLIDCEAVDLITSGVDLAQQKCFALQCHDGERVLPLANLEAGFALCVRGRARSKRKW